ncbi:MULTISPECIES: ATP-binding protein [unclassified Bradyrhizobium]|uniref:ATP-binding protein n=1 Tax=unclassified Bradyrhizobium TaxID=2631580 RepID=UPI0028EC928A|nr:MULTISPECIES: ATP-binding protein [unclassified Bradyrhizobium]
MRLFRSLRLVGIRSQITALVAASIIALHVIITAVFVFHRAEQREPDSEFGPSQLTTVVRILAHAPASDRPRVMADVTRAFPDFDIKSYSGPLPSGEAPRPVYHGFRALGPSYQFFPLPPEGERPGEIVVFPDGSMISARFGNRSHRPPFWGGPWFTTVMFALISITMLGLWAARALTAPLTSFARAAESFSLDGDAPLLPERGPEEIRSLARALNRMRERITTLIDDRTKMLAAISHDLRTPLTRMRLRCEFVEDEIQRGRMLADLNQMHAMLGSVLSFLRHGRKLEPMTLVEVASILQLVADQFTDMGHKVCYVGPAHAMATVRPDDLLRTVTNLVDNAVKFGTETVIRLTVAPDVLTIDVEDDGPGISDAHKPQMLEPFVRGDQARNMDEATGFGLGLSIAKSIVAAHGGELSLHDREPHGLIARIRLPLRQAPRLRPAA